MIANVDLRLVQSDFFGLHTHCCNIEEFGKSHSARSIIISVRLKNILLGSNQKVWLAALSVSGSVVLVGGVVAFTPLVAVAASVPSIDLGTAGAYSVLAGSTITNTGNSTLQGDLGLSPGTAVTGFPPGLVSGATNVGNANAEQAQVDTTTAYTQAVDASPSTTQPADLIGLTLSPGVYSVPAGISNLTGTLTLNGQGNPDAVFIFQMPSTLITSSASDIVLENDANACNIFWQVTSSATLGTGSSFQGTIIALTSITADTGATITGRLLARNGAVTLDSNTIANPVCSATTTTTPPTATPTGATVVPASHTGEPWSGWPWWLGVGIMGSAGLLLLRPRLARAHQIR